MSAFEDEIAKAVVLSLFLPLIISSGGNSGSQATSIIIRSLALREVKLRDWWRVASREVASGVALGMPPGLHRLPPHRHLGEGVPPLRRALPPGGLHRGAEPGRGGALREPGRLDAPVPAPAAGVRSGEGVGAVRGDAGRRQRADHLLHRGEPDPRGVRAATVARPARARCGTLLLGEHSRSPTHRSGGSSAPDADAGTPVAAAADGAVHLRRSNRDPACPARRIGRCESAAIASWRRAQPVLVEDRP